jgi:hypothetical protein
MVALLVLTACASPTAVATTQPSFSDQVGTVVAATMQALPSNTPEPASQDQGELTFRVVKQLGGLFDAVAVDGNTLYLGIGARFTTIDIGDPSSPRLLWQSEVLTDLPASIAVQSGMAYLRVGSEMVIYDVSDPVLPSLAGRMSDVSGDLFAAGKFVYTVTSFPADQPMIAIDVSDPAHPAEVGRRAHSGNPALAVSGSVLYLASVRQDPVTHAYEGTLQLVDPTNLERTFSEIALDGAQGYQVALGGDLAYVVENRLTEDPDVLLVLDVSDPAQPREIARRAMVIEGTISEIVVTDKALFLLSRSYPHSGCPTSLYIIDITDPALPQARVRFEPQSCFNRFTVGGDTLTVTSELGLEIYSVSDPASITLTSELAPLDGFITADRIALNQNLAYLVTTAGRNRLARLRVLDLASPTPNLLHGDGFDWGYHELSIFGGLAVRGDRLFGLGPSAVDISDPANPRMAAGDLGVDNAEGVFYWPIPARVGNVLYTGLLTNTPDGLRISGGFGIIDISDPAKPVLVEKVLMEGATVTGLSVTGHHLIVFSQKESTRLHVFDISDPLTPVEIGLLEPAVDLSEQMQDFALSADTVYAASRGGTEVEGFKITIYTLDISDPSQPRQISRFELPDRGLVNKMVSAGDTIYMLLNQNGNEALNKGIRALNVSDKTHPYLSGYFPFNVSDFALDGDMLYLAAGDAGLVIVQVE